MMAALPRPQLKGLFWRHFKLVWLGGLAVGATASFSWYTYMAKYRVPFKLSKQQQVAWDAVAAEIYTKPHWEDDWESAVKNVFKTGVNKNLGLNKYMRSLNDPEQNYFDQYDLPVNYKYKGLHVNDKTKPWLRP